MSQWINASLDSKTKKPRALSRAIARQIEDKWTKPKGWMDRPHAEDGSDLDTPVADQRPVGAHLHEVTDAEWAMLTNYRKLLDKDRKVLDTQIGGLAEERQAEMDEFFKRFGVTQAAERSHARKARSSASTSTEIGDHLRQELLPLDPAPPDRKR